jgi:hypothetical protein
MVQCAKDAMIRESKDQRSRRRVIKATETPQTMTSMAGDREGSELRRLNYAGFARWFGMVTSTGIMSGLSWEEENRVRNVAWNAYHGGIEHATIWSKTLVALHTRHREAGELSSRRWHQNGGRESYEDAKPLGW